MSTITISRRGRLCTIRRIVMALLTFFAASPLFVILLLREPGGPSNLEKGIRNLIRTNAPRYSNHQGDRGDLPNDSKEKRIANLNENKVRNGNDAVLICGTKCPDNKSVFRP